RGVRSCRARARGARNREPRRGGTQPVRSRGVAVLPIRKLGDPVLRERARDVERFDRSLARIVDDMFETMYAAPGVGLAAPQVGISLRFFVYDDGEGHRGFVANPELSELERHEVRDEGCLSIPGPF